MTDTLTYSGAHVPEADEANDVPAALLQFGTDIDQLLVLKATSTANRNSLYANVDAGTLVSCAAESAVWQKTTTPPTAAAWLTLFELTEVTTGVATAATNFTLSTQWGRKRNGLLSIRLVLDYSGSDIVGDGTGTSSPGNVTDTTVATLTADWRPPVIWNVPFRSPIADWMGFVSNSTGILTLASGPPSGKLRTGDQLVATVTYPQV